MYSVRVMPVAKGIFKDYLTFFSREKIPEGSVVETNIRGRKVPGIVLEVTDVRDLKSDIRSADFALKKLELDTEPTRVFSSEFIAAIRETARFHAASDSAVAASLAPASILTSLSGVAEAPIRKTPEKSATKSEVVLLQAEYAERVRTYRNLVREAFARKSSVMILAPTVSEAERLSKELSRGIEDSVIVLTGDMPKKKFLTHWNRTLTSPEPCVIIGTPLALSLPRHDIDTLVIERESAKSYRALQRPYLDMRHAAEYVAKGWGARFILADFPLRSETRHRLEGHEADELSRMQVRPQGTTEVGIVDTRPQDSKRGEKRVFTTLSTATKDVLKEELRKGGRAVVFAARRGIAPLTVCNDCGTPVTDPVSGTPMVLHKTEKGNVFISGYSGAVIPAETSCRVCGGWNLATLGIGIDRVYDEVVKEFPDAQVILFTKDTAPTHRTAQKLSDKFYGGNNAIIVGTERMLPYLSAPVEISAVASIDSLLSLPAWRAHEHALSILFYLRERAENRLIIETRQPEHVVMKTIESGNPADFYREEIQEREKYSYPPFAVFVGLTALGGKAEVEKARELIESSFKDYDLVGPMPAEAREKNIWSAKAVIRLSKGTWPDEALLEKLKSLPPNILIAIDPDELV